MEIHQRSFETFLGRLEGLVRHVCDWPDASVMLAPAATLDNEAGASRCVTWRECELTFATYSRQVLARIRPDQEPFVLGQLPEMVNGEFLIRGQRRLIMLRKRRANVPVNVGGSVTVMGAKVDVHSGRIMAPGSGKWQRIDACKPWNDHDPRELIDYVASHPTQGVWHTGDLASIRVQRPHQQLMTLWSSVLRSCLLPYRRRGVWPHEMVTSAVESALATGNWRNGAVGVTQLRNLSNEVSASAQFLTVVGSSNEADRFVHPSTWCVFCCSETPEGEKCGLVHHLTSNVRIADAIDMEPPPRKATGKCLLFWNGVPHGRTDGIVDGVACITRGDEVWAWTDEGRLEPIETPDPRKHMLGYAASRIPFAQHNQSPRVSYYSAMSKQAMSLPRPDAPTKHTLCYGQKSLVGPESQAGLNVVIAIMPLGYNIEDALVFNKAAVDRGLFRSETHGVHHYTDECHLRPGDTLTSGNLEETVVSVTVDASNRYVVRTVSHRVPEVGDKFCSRAGQKGTMGIALPQEDLPFTSDGISPDVVINPHAFPSRMTVSQMYEMAFGMLATYGVKVDASPFAPVPDVQALLRAHGLPASGKVPMFNGCTGELLEAKVFMGMCFYQRLHHMSLEKCYSRRGGPVDAITNQPVAGRKHGGGLRLGEMEKDCIHGSGALGVLSERMSSIGRTTMAVCTECGSSVGGCSHKPQRTARVELPHASRLLLAELQAMLIKTSVG